MLCVTVVALGGSCVPGAAVPLVCGVSACREFGGSFCTVGMYWAGTVPVVACAPDTGAAAVTTAVCGITDGTVVPGGLTVYMGRT